VRREVSASETISGKIDIQAGALKAKPTPMRNTQIRIRPGLRRCNQSRIAKAAAAVANQRLITHSSFLRSTMSARAPAGNVSRKNGSAATVDITYIKSGEGVSVFITQVAAVS
jgi:hypothetical protein